MVGIKNKKHKTRKKKKKKRGIERKKTNIRGELLGRVLDTCLVEEGIDVLLFLLVVPVKLFVVEGLLGIKDPVEHVEEFTNQLRDLVDAQLHGHNQELVGNQLEVRLEITFFFFFFSSASKNKLFFFFSQSNLRFKRY